MKTKSTQQALIDLYDINIKKQEEVARQKDSSNVSNKENFLKLQQEKEELIKALKKTTQERDTYRNNYTLVAAENDTLRSYLDLHIREKELLKKAGQDSVDTLNKMELYRLLALEGIKEPGKFEKALNKSNNIYR